MFIPIKAVGQIRLFHLLFKEKPGLAVCVLVLLIAIAWHLNWRRHH